MDPTRFSMNLISQLSRAKSSRGLTPETLTHLEKVFRETCGAKGEIGLSEFKKIIQSKNEFFAERMFKMFDTDSSGTISLEEFLTAMRRFSCLSPVEKLRHVFAVYDIDGDGAIQLSELRSVIKECMSENNLKFSEHETDALAFLLFHEADVDKSGAINFDEFKEQLARHPGLIENLSMSVEHWLIPPMPKSFLATHRPRKLSWKYIRNNLNGVIFLIVFLGILVALFASRLVQYHNTTGFFMMARGCAQCLNFLCSFLVVCVCRRTITILRVQGLSEYLPLDSHIYFHKFAGCFVFFFSMLHTIMHICNFAYISRLTGIPFGSMIIEPIYDLGWVGGAACITGWIMLTVLIVMVFSSLPYVRRNEYFEVFYYVHLLYAAFFVLLILHGGNFWKWFIAPGTLFLIELLIRVYRFISPSTSVAYVQKSVLLPSKVTHLVIKRPSHFVFAPGDYIFVNIPQIAKHEWHPFTISSCPEEDGVIWLHIRGNGNWTNSLYAQFHKVITRAVERPSSIRLDSLDNSGYTNIVFDQNENMDNSVVLRTLTRNVLQREMNLASPSTISGPSTVRSGSDNNSHLCVSPKLSPNENSPPEVMRHSSPPGLDTSMTSLTSTHVVVPVSPTKTVVRHTMSSPDGGRPGLRGSKKINSINPGRSLRRVLSSAASHRPSLSDIGAALKRYRKKKDDDDALKRKRNIVYLKTGDEEDSIISKSHNVRRLSPSSIGSFGDSYVQVREEGEAIHWNNRMQIRIDGPYGSPSSHIFRAQHAVLIGTGIGVTPFASILQSIVHRYRKSHHSCPYCQQTWVDTIPSNIMNLKKVDFFWINRNQDAFEWFVSLLSDLEVEQAKMMAEDTDRFLDIHMYITSALHKNDMKALGLQIALDLLHDKEKRDLITGLKTRTHPGRPNWDEVFAQISREKKGKVTVFFCGPAEVGRMLHTKCNDYGFSFKKEIF